MKLALALLLGVVSANDLKALRNKINNLRIEVSELGQEVIENRANHVHDVAEEIRDTRPVRNLRRSLGRWADSREVRRLEELDQRFWNSEDGQRLARQWQDVGEVLEENVVETENGVHISNAAVEDLGDELEDVGDEYHDLEDSHWANRYENRWNDAKSNEEAERVQRRFKAFKNSEAGHSLKRAVKSLKRAIRNNVEVSDVPDDWELNLMKAPRNQVAQATNMARRQSVPSSVLDHNSFVNMVKVHQTANAKPKKATRGLNKDTFNKSNKKGLSHLNNMLHIEVHHPNRIANAVEDVHDVADAIQDTRPARNLRRSIRSWGDSEEVHRLQRLDERFQASDRGQRLIREWEDVFQALNETVTVERTNNGASNELHLHVNNDAMQEVEDELEDVGAEYDDLEGTRWDRRYTRAWRRALNNDEFQRVKRRNNQFYESTAGQWLHEVNQDLWQTVHDNVEVSDVPEGWQTNMFLF